MTKALAPLGQVDMFAGTVDILMERDVDGGKVLLACDKFGGLTFLLWDGENITHAADADTSFPLEDIAGELWDPVSPRVIDPEALHDAVEALLYSDTEAKINASLSLVDEASGGCFPIAVDIEDGVATLSLDGNTKQVKARTAREVAAILAAFAMEEFKTWL